MKRSDSIEAQPASELIDERIAELGDWRGDTLARMRKLIKEEDLDVILIGRSTEQQGGRHLRAVGALALGALALGAFAVGALAIGRMAIGRARIRRMEIDELTVRSLRITERLDTPANAGSGSL
jgi:hypothetical protein